MMTSELLTHHHCDFDRLHTSSTCSILVVELLVC